MELNRFSNIQQNDDRTYSTECPLFRNDESSNQEQALKNFPVHPTNFSPNFPIDELRNGSNDSRFGTTISTLSEFYAQLIVIIAAISVFIEILPGPLHLFQCHVYIFTILLGSGIILLFHGFVRSLNNKFFQEQHGNHRSTQKCLTSCNENKAKNYFSFYLKFGILVFGLQVLISKSLGFVAIFDAPRSCVNEISTALPILEAIFIFFEIIFIITNSIDTYSLFGSCHNFFTMHLIAINAALLIHMFLWETAKDWQDVLHFKHDSSKKFEQNAMNITVHALESMNMTSPNHVVHITSNCWWRISEYDVMEDITAIDTCLQNSTVGLISGKATQFLYPFMVQYFMIAIYFLYLICYNFKYVSIQCQQSVLLCDANHNMGICSRSTKGLSLGFLVFISAVVYLILYLVMDHLKFSVILMSEYCFIFGLSTIAGIMCLFQIKSLFIVKDTYDFQLKLVQKIGTVVIYVYGTCNLIVGFFSTDKFRLLLVLEGILMIVQVTVQYIVTLQINTKKVDHSNINEKPGRQAIGFLILCNISLWLLDCFVSWNNIQNHLQFELLGAIAWHVIARILFPMIAFYRFYSAVVLFEAWKTCYF